MKNAQKIFIIFALFLVSYSCSTKKDTVISRNYQALTTKFNVLFNGKEAFKQGIEEINSQYKDDWFQRLPIEAIEFEEDKIAVPKYNNGPGAGFGGNNNNTEEKKLTTFERAEEKAVKAIQKHGMNIDGLERNRQIDDAYLLLGKARYYQQRFIPAIDAFNYVIAEYPNADLIAETKIWRAKANIRNDNEETAIEAMKLLLVVKDTLEAEFPNKIKEQGHTALAMAYIKTDSLENAKKHLMLATRTLENRNQGARNLYVLGQMYSEENKKDSASQVFRKLASFKKAPYKYKVRANIELARNVVNDSSSAAVLNTLHKLIKIRENRPYLDELYYQAAVLYEKSDSTQLAIDSYNNSLRAKNGSEKQKTFTFEKLGNLSFKDAKYLQASAYYDSVMQFTTDTLNIRIRRVKRKYKNLASLIKFEEVVTVNDSILKITAMTEEQQKEFFEGYIAKLKKADEDAAQLRLNQMAFANNGTGLIGTNKGKWYFYNSQSLSFGQTEFQRVWGTRKLEDDWRWADKVKLGVTEKDAELTETKNPKYDVDSYLATIPNKIEDIDSLKINRNQALYELGIIYKEQFKNLNLAKDRLLRVADLNTNPELTLPINWHLYQVYEALNDSESGASYKNVILTEYPDTKFAQIIKNPNDPLKEQEVATSEVQNYYKEMYYLFKEDKYDLVVKNIDEFIVTIPNSELLPKFELLKAYAIGKNSGKNLYIDALDFVSVNYKGTEEGTKANEILEKLNKEEKE